MMIYHYYSYISLFQANRAELTPQQLQRVQYEGAECVIDRNLARDDAQKLYQAGEKKLGTDESVFLQVMAVRHYYQLRATFEEYVRVMIVFLYMVLSLTEGTALCPLVRCFILCLILVQPRKTCPELTEKVFTWM